MKFRRIYQLPYLGILVWPFIFAIAILPITPLYMLKGLWEGFNRGGERVNHYLFESRFRPWVIIPKVWDNYKLKLSRKHRMFPNGINHMKRRFEAE